jgi:hypothetical protein
MLKHGLGRLERAAAKLAGGACPVCRGDPFVVVRRTIQADPEGSELRVVDERLEDEADRARLTDDLRCRRCGAPAEVTTLVFMAGVPGADGGWEGGTC